MRYSLVLLFFLGIFIVPTVCQSRPDTEEDDELAEVIASPCMPSNAQLIKQANEDCLKYSMRVCVEAKNTLVNCSLAMCQEETERRCPYRDLVRASSNRYIKKVAIDAGIWEEKQAAEYCQLWYARELMNITRLAAVWDMLSIMPCPYEELTIRKSPCFQIDTQGIAPTHPLAKWCYNSFPTDLNIGSMVSTQCCYGADLRLLVLGHKGAGSVDFSSKISLHENAFQDHFAEDVLPYLACCALSNNCFKFSAVRPASLRPETDQEFNDSCHVLSSTYQWKPYSYNDKNYEPPYTKDDIHKVWKDLSLNGSSLVPTEELQFVLHRAQEVRDLIHAGKNPYVESSTHHEAEATTTTKRPTTSTTEETEATTKRATSKPKDVSVSKTTSKSSSSATSKPKDASPKSQKELDHANAKEGAKVKTVADKSKEEIDNVIETVLKGVAKPIPPKNKDTKNNDPHKSEDSDGKRSDNRDFRGSDSARRREREEDHWRDDRGREDVRSVRNGDKGSKSLKNMLDQRKK